MNDDKKLEVIWVQPMMEPQLIEIDNDLESMQELVDGYIEEYMPFEDDAAIVCNERILVGNMMPKRDREAVALNFYGKAGVWSTILLQNLRMVAVHSVKFI